jgi:hypothetical protein
MPKPEGTHWVVTANFTDDGATAYLRSDGTWSRRLAEAATFADGAAKDGALAEAQGLERLVCDPYAFMVEVTKAGIDPLSARETIRAAAEPTVPMRRPDESKPPRRANVSIR